MRASRAMSKVAAGAPAEPCLTWIRPYTISSNREAPSKGRKHSNVLLERQFMPHCLQRAPACEAACSRPELCSLQASTCCKMSELPLRAGFQACPAGGNALQTRPL